ncbi:hypothetical protein BDV93DRAFT_524954 [Ceratobasidium sp. AG-I]|nr:hypothetical protein BDV93DRAFT_524954 [Ceratobasidium sp. AG-I]
MNPSDKFTAVVRGSSFILTRSQVEFDSPNYFTACFLGNFKESQTRILEISRDPVLFGVIFDYLCGYTVLPLDKSVIPTRMSLATALANLRVDAEFYQLDGLVRACDNLASPRPASSHNTETHAVISGISPSTNRGTDMKAYLATFRDFGVVPVGREMLSQAPFFHLNTASSCVGFQGIRELSGIRIIVDSLMGSSNGSSWRIAGWRITNTERYTAEILIVVETRL